MSRLEELFSPRGCRGGKITKITETEETGLMALRDIRIVSATKYQVLLKEYQDLQRRYLVEENKEKLAKLEKCFLRVIINPKLPMGRSGLDLPMVKKIHRRQRRGYSFYCTKSIKEDVRVKKEDLLLQEVISRINTFWKKIPAK